MDKNEGTLVTDRLHNHVDRTIRNDDSCPACIDYLAMVAELRPPLNPPLEATE